MTYEAFQEHIINYLMQTLGEHVKITMQQITKNNNIILDGLTIIEAGCNISPTIYLNSFYDQFQQDQSLTSIQSQILDIYLKNRPTENIDVSFFTDYDQISDNVLFKLINTKENEELLQEIPHINYLDLSIVFYCLITSAPKGNATILIRNSHIDLWSISISDLYKKAFYNTPRLLPADLFNMVHFLQDQCSLDDFNPQTDTDLTPMYVLSNSKKLFGAGCMLYPDYLKKIAQKFDRDLCILPSSIHEIIIIPMHQISGITELNQMVQEVNQTQVEPEEILSDHIYLYSLSRQTILIPECNQLLSHKRS